MMGGSTYVGQVNADDKPHGKGKKTWPDSCVYDGDWVNGVREGKGTLEEHGEGICTWPDGRKGKYEGGWEEGKEHGIGTMSYSDGSTYVGEWQRGTRWGKGVQTAGDGTVVYDGIWVCDKEATKKSSFS